MFSLECLTTQISILINTSKIFLISYLEAINAKILIANIFCFINLSKKKTFLPNDPIALRYKFLL